jgi:hypothetical protein
VLDVTRQTTRLSVPVLAATAQAGGQVVLAGTVRPGAMIPPGRMHRFAV